MMEKEILEYKIKKYYDIFGLTEPYATRFLLKDNLAQIEEATKAVDWSIENNKVLLFYPEADKVLKAGYKPTQELWDII
jgi:hypothetical protein